jgi:hypothetical protein
VYYDGAKAQSCIVQNFCTTSGQSSLFLPSTSNKKIFFPLQTLLSHNPYSQMS